MKDKRKFLLISTLNLSLIFLLSGCSIGNIKIVEKVKPVEIKKDYGDVEVKEPEEIDKTKNLKDEIIYNPDEEVVCSADGFVFKKADFTISPLVDTIITERPDSGNEKSVKTGELFSVIGVSENKEIYMLDVKDKYYFIKAKDSSEEKEYDEKKKKEKEEAEQKAALEKKKKEDEEKKALEEAHKVDQEKKRQEQQKKEQQKNKNKNRQSTARPAPKPNQSQRQTVSRPSQSQQINPSTNSSSTQPTYTTEPSNNNYQSQEDNNTTYYTYTYTDEDTRPSNIPIPTGGSTEHVGNVKLYVLNRTVTVVENASLNSAPGEPIAGSNVYSFGYYPPQTTFQIDGITENGYVRTVYQGVYVFIHGRYLR